MLKYALAIIYFLKAASNLQTYAFKRAYNFQSIKMYDSKKKKNKSGQFLYYLYLQKYINDGRWTHKIPKRN